MSTPDVKLQAVLRSACPPSEEQRSRLKQIAEACPVHKLLVGEVRVVTALA